MKNGTRLTRRELLRDSATMAGALAMAGAPARPAWARGSDALGVGVIGCGARGRHAARDCVRAAAGVKITALADAFRDRLEPLRDRFRVPAARCFAGLDGYR